MDKKFATNQTETNLVTFSQNIYDIVVEEVDVLYPQFMKRVNNIDIDYFEDITRNSEELPKELSLELRGQVLSDVRSYAMQLLEGSNIKARIAGILRDVDATIKKQVFDSSKRRLCSYVYNSSLLNGSSAYTEEALQKMYTDAKKRSLCELINRNNKEDVIRFHNALMDKTYEQCKDVLYESIDSFFSKIEEQ